MNIELRFFVYLLLAIHIGVNAFAFWEVNKFENLMWIFSIITMMGMLLSGLFLRTPLVKITGRMVALSMVFKYLENRYFETTVYQNSFDYIVILFVLAVSVRLYNKDTIEL